MFRFLYRRKLFKIYSNNVKIKNDLEQKLEVFGENCLDSTQLKLLAEARVKVRHLGKVLKIKEEPNEN